jgi:molybdopterin synthase sulfur carrier subunit
VDILYFAWVRERIGKDREHLDPPKEIKDVRGLMAWLAARSPGHSSALNDMSRLRAAVDQQFVTLDAPIEGAQEIAIFPPVTGG